MNCFIAELHESELEPSASKVPENPDSRRTPAQLQPCAIHLFLLQPIVDTRIEEESVFHFKVKATHFSKVLGHPEDFVSLYVT
jgi:hypothetical protein